MGMEVRVSCRDVCLNILEQLLVVRLKKAIFIWRELFEEQIRQTFIKSSMSGNFHFVGLTVMPEEISRGHGCATKKDAFSCNQSEFGWSATWQSHSNSAAKFSEASPFFLQPVVISVGLAVWPANGSELKICTACKRQQGQNLIGRSAPISIA